jgi:putative Ca2+/H+ antiporter (TMEM165/GDT1 family)
MASNDTSSDESQMHALLSAFTMIIFSEIGDKTFLIAAILAMKHPRTIVFAGAFGSLVVMSILSAMMGHILPALLPKSITELAAAVLFFGFGGKMFIEGKEMKLGNQKLQEEMKEAQEEIEEDEVLADGTNGIPLEAVEEGGRSRHHRSKSLGGPAKSLAEGFRNFFSFFLGPIFVQAFVLTFLGEWGDRSQISTIALGAAHVCLSAWFLLPSH